MLTPSRAPTQDGIVKTICEGADLCIDASLEIVFDDPGIDGLQVDGSHDLEIVDGMTGFVAIVVLDTQVEGVQGWSYGVSHDPAVLSIGDNPCEVPGDDFMCGTDANAGRFPPSFNVSAVVGPCGEGGPEGFISATTISLGGGGVNLLPGRNSMAFIPYNIVNLGAIGPESSIIRIEDNALCNAPSPRIQISFVSDGVSFVPSTLIHGIVANAGSVEAPFLRGDADGGGSVNISDAVHVLRYVVGLFRNDAVCLVGSPACD